MRDLHPMDAPSQGTRLAFLHQPPGHFTPLQIASSLEHRGAFVQQQAPAFGYDVVPIPINPGEDGGRLAASLRQLDVRGIFLDRLAGDLGFFQQFPWAEFAVVNFDRRLVVPSFDTVRIAIADGVEGIARRLADRGYRRVVAQLFEHRPSHPDDEERLAALRHFFGPSLPIHVSDFTSEPPPSWLGWLDEHRPDAVVGFNRTGLHWLARVGRRVPDDVGFVALTFAAENPRPVSGQVSKRAEVARLGLERMGALLQHGWLGIPPLPAEIVVPSTWIEGGTLPPRVASRGTVEAGSR